jgi:hypothetical protein
VRLDESKILDVIKNLAGAAKKITPYIMTKILILMLTGSAFAKDFNHIANDIIV